MAIGEVGEFSSLALGNDLGDPSDRARLFYGGVKHLKTDGAITLDQDNTNNGTLVPGLNFGSGNVGLASKRTAGGNQNGLDLYTNSTPQMSITSTGNVSIGATELPTAKLEINGDLKLQQGIAVNEFSSDGTLSGNSNLAVPTEKATKAYVDTQITQVKTALMTKAALGGAATQNFQTKSLTVTGNLDVTDTTTFRSNVGIGTTNPTAKLDVIGNIKTTGAISGSSLPPNLIRNSYMNILDGDRPAGYDSRGKVVLKAVHPYTKGFEGPYLADKPGNATNSVESATESSPYWFGKYNKGSRATRGGLADGWHSLSDGRILKITGDNSGEHTCIFFPFERNVLASRVHFKAWLKISSGKRVGFGSDSGHLNTVRGFLLTKEETSGALDGWYQIDTIIDISEVTSLDDLAFSMGIEADGIFEVYLALPYLTNLDNDTWLPSVSDMLSRDGLTIHPSSGKIGIGAGATSPSATLHIDSQDVYAFKISNPALSKAAGMGIDRYGVWIEPEEMDSGIRLNANPSLFGLYVRGTDGNVGVGTLTPAAKLHVNGGAVINRIGIGIPSAGMPYPDEAIGPTVGNRNLRIYAPGFIYFHTGSLLKENVVIHEDGHLSVDQDINCYHGRIIAREGNIEARQGDVYARGLKLQSSRDLKENVTDFSSQEAAEVLRGLNPVKFNYKTDKEKTSCIGFIAEDVPEVVTSIDRKMIQPMDIISVLTKVVKEQQEVIATLVKKVKVLEEKNKV